MRTLVHRVQLALVSTSVDIPSDARIIHVAWKADESRPSIWYAFDAALPRGVERRRFLVVGTGHELVTDGDLPPFPLGSVIAPDGFHVFHVFEARPC